MQRQVWTDLGRDILKSAHLQTEAGVHWTDWQPRYQTLAISDSDAHVRLVDQRRKFPCSSSTVCYDRRPEKSHALKEHWGNLDGTDMFFFMSAQLHMMRPALNRSTRHRYLANSAAAGCKDWRILDGTDIFADILIPVQLHSTEMMASVRMQ